MSNKQREEIGKTTTDRLFEDAEGSLSSKKWAQHRDDKILDFLDRPSSNTSPSTWVRPCSVVRRDHASFPKTPADTGVGRARPAYCPGSRSARSPAGAGFP